MNKIKQVGQILWRAFVLLWVVGGLAFIAIAVLLYFDGGTSDVWLNGYLGAVMLLLGGVLAITPHMQRQNAAHTAERMELRRAALRAGFQEWAASRGLTVTEADAINVATAQMQRLQGSLMTRF